MGASEKLNLSEIADISEDEFKKQLLAWIDDRGVSRALQSKLRTELFEHFNRTQLGRQIAVQHQRSHRIELSPLVLVLNTLVAEFLYTENCHFSLSVFSAEVPYKNTLPDFDAASMSATRKPFRLSDHELNDIFDAIGLTATHAKAVQNLYTKDDSHNGMVKPLLYCIFKLLFVEADATQPKTKEMNKDLALSEESDASGESMNQSPDKRKKMENYQISSSYFKYLNRYLDILAERIRDMSHCLAETSTKTKSGAETSALELKETVDKLTQSVSHLTKSKRKSKKLLDLLHTIDRLSTNLETCANNMERLLDTVTGHTQRDDNNQSKPSPIVSQERDARTDTDYCTWLRQLKTSENGRRFVNRLEQSLHKTLAKERESLQKIYEEKMKNYRMLIKTYYKQKYTRNVKGNKAKSSPTAKRPDMQHHIVPEIHLPSKISKSTTNRTEDYVDQIVQTARVRLHDLESESEKLEKSFQEYLKKQMNQKIQSNQEVTSIWQDYTFGKRLLDVQNSPAAQRDTSFEPIKQSNSMSTTNVLAAEIDSLLQVNPQKSFGNPFRQFSTDKLFSKRTVTSAKVEIPAITFGDHVQREKDPIRTMLQAISSESSYEQVATAKKLNSNVPHKDVGLISKPVNEVTMPAEIVDTMNTSNIETKPPAIDDQPTYDISESIESRKLSDGAPPKIVEFEKLPASQTPDVIAPTPQHIVVDIKSAIKANDLPVETPDTFGSDLELVTDEELDESLEISVGPKREHSSSEDAWN